MNLLKWLLSFYIMSAADGDDGGPVDRGDVVADAVATEEIHEAAAEEPAEAEAEPEQDTQPREADGKFAKKEGKGVIPVDRHEAVLEKERIAREAAEARLAEMERQVQQQTVSADVRALEDKITELEDAAETARMEGDKSKAIELSREIRQLERQINESRVSVSANNAREQALEDVRMTSTIERLESSHEVLQPGNDAYDQDVVDMVLATQRDLMARDRLPPSRALELAANKVLAKVMPASREDVKSSGLSAAKGTDRAKEQIAKNLDTTKRQPASMKEIGEDSDSRGQKSTEPNAADMSFEEFAALPEATKARMRGDLI